MYDVIIIGGGAMGTSIARRLSSYEIKGILLEKNPGICQETSKANSAIVHSGYDARPGSLKARLNVRGSQLYPQLAQDLGFGYRPIGSLVLAFNSQEEAVLEELYERGLKNGVKGLELIDGDQARALEASISPEVIRALHSPTAAVVDPFNYCYSMMDSALENSFELRTNSQVTGLRKEGEELVVETSSGEYRTRYLINAAGLFSDKLAEMAGDRDFYIIPTRGVYRILARGQEPGLTKVLFQAPSEKGKGVLVTPTYAGNTMLGPTSDRLDRDLPSEEESLEQIDSLARRSVPDLKINRSIRTFIGLRAKPSTGDFMIYPSKNLVGLVHVAGIESPGISSAPAIAEYVEGILRDLGWDYKKKENFIARTERIPNIKDLEASQQEEKIRENPLYGNIICKCENISEGEIIDAIRRPVAARSQSEVKRRVRAGMGPCQGRRCGPKVREILSRELNIDLEDMDQELSGRELMEKYIK